MWGQPIPPSGNRQLARLAAGGLLIFKGHERAESLRRSAKRMPKGLEREAKLAMAAWLDWAADHPAEAVDQGEAVLDWLRQPPPAHAGIRWA
jgi:hypothetical protein